MLTSEHNLWNSPHLHINNLTPLCLRQHLAYERTRKSTDKLELRRRPPNIHKKTLDKRGNTLINATRWGAGGGAGVGAVEKVAENATACRACVHSKACTSSLPVTNPRAAPSSLFFSWWIARVLRCCSAKPAPLPPSPPPPAGNIYRQSKAQMYTLVCRWCCCCSTLCWCGRRRHLPG